jgi:predicted amidophosphoribosyltransferase
MSSRRLRPLLLATATLAACAEALRAAGARRVTVAALARAP